MILIDGYRVDLAVNEEHDHPSEVTKLHVEDGSLMSDHNRILNDVITIEGIVSDTPIDAAIIAARSGDTKPSDEARAKFLAIRAARKPVTIVTSRAQYDNMALIGFTESDSSEKGGGLFFTLKFEVQQTSKVERVPVAVPGLNDQQDLGNRPVKYVSFGTDKFLHDISSGMWLDPDLTVYVKATPGVDVPDLHPGETTKGELRRFDVWRKSSKYDQTKRIYNVQKGPLRDGFYGTDDKIKEHVVGLTAQQRKALIPPSAPGSKENTAADLAKRTRERDLRTDDSGRVFTMSKSDPRYKDTKPYVPPKTH